MFNASNSVECVMRVPFATRNVTMYVLKYRNSAQSSMDLENQYSVQYTAVYSCYAY